MAMSTELQTITGVLDALGCTWHEASENDRIDAVQPALVCMPGSVEQAAAALAACNERGLATVPRGSGTKLGLGNPLQACDVIIDMSRLNRVIDFMPDNLTVTVEAGMTLAELQTTLAAQNQLLPLDPPYADSATIGGIVAANSSGGLRLLYGAMRDLIVGSQVALPDGRLARAGGRVVKNVAGYDLNKLWTGSLGTLALFTEFTFKLAPQTEADGTLLSVFENVQKVAPAISGFVRSVYGPAALDLFDRTSFERLAAQIHDDELAGLAAGLPQHGTVLAVRGRGLQAVVNRQMNGMGELAAEAGATNNIVLPDQAAVRFWQTAADYPALAPDRLIVKIATVLTALNETYAVIADRLQTHKLSAFTHGHAGSGIVYVQLESPDDPAAAAEFVREMRRYVAKSRGSAVIERAPLALRQQIDVWGDPGNSLPAMRALKSKFDPKAILNRGRYVGGI